MKRFGKSGKLSPRFVGRSKILDKIGPVAYRLALPPQLWGVHNVFHVSMLRKYEPDPSHVISFEPIAVREALSYIEHPIQIIDHKEQELRNKVIPLVRVQRKHHSPEELTLEWEADI